ncbi:MAG: alginate lyase family protein [Cyanobacteria bacterium J06635_1]
MLGHQTLLICRQGFNKIKRESFKLFFLRTLLLKEGVTENFDFLSGNDFSTDAFCLAYPQSVQHLLRHFDLRQPGFQTVGEAVQQKNWPAACTALLQYYQAKVCPLRPYATWLGLSTHGVNGPQQKTPSSVIARANALLNHTFTFQAVTGTLPIEVDGQLDWSYSGPNDDQEWAWFLNRHGHLLDLLTAYRATQDERFVHCINHHIISWVLFSVSPKGTQGRTQWRGLEVAYRAMHWVWVFEELRQVAAFSPVARLLMLASLMEHGRYLRRMHAWGANWITREMGALAALALAWPEFKAASAWREYALKRMIWESQDQVYPDGTQKELSSHYHWITLRDFQNFVNCLEEAGQEVPTGLEARVEKMWSYLAYAMRPDGASPLNNDSDRQWLASEIQQFAISYQRPDWTYIATHGSCGRPPALPSAVFPWAGQLIMRSGWDAQAHWGFFDFGPMGVFYHIHRDKLHLSVSAYGRDLLVDGGRYRYVRDPFWHYFRGSQSHNVILVDGHGQRADIPLTRAPLSAQFATHPTFDFAEGTARQGFEKIIGRVVHQRAVVYLRNKFWVVIDHIQTDRPRQLNPLWHFHPDCTVEIADSCVQSVDAQVGNLKIQPVSPLNWSIKLIRGQEDPVQGWWSREYNHRAPATAAIYETKIERSTTFGWVLWPAQDRPPTLNIEHIPSPVGTFVMRLHMPQSVAVVVRLIDGLPLPLPNGQQLNGRCCVLMPNQPPTVALGNLL